ncbi:MAG: tail fiber domain-containing protein, partial [Pyrinomonadaceae bacterium]
TTGSRNSFFGLSAGGANTSGGDNSFFGYQAGDGNTTGHSNAFFGFQAGVINTTGSNNTFIGRIAGNRNITGSNNTVIGYNAQVRFEGLSYATAIGAGAMVESSNTIVLGRRHGTDDVEVPGYLTAYGGITASGPLTVTGSVRVHDLSTGGVTPVCRNPGDFLATCSSSLRYKTSVQPFTGGLNLVNRLRPITFSWRDGGMKDVGFGAEDVEKVEPRLVTYNPNGAIEGVKYGQITTVLVNAVQQQQQIIERQQRQIDALKNLVCLSHPEAEACAKKR